MAVTEETRHRLHMKFEEVVGPEVAVTLMEHLPPVGWADVATKRDLDHQTTILQRDLQLRTAELRTEMADLRTDLRTEMAELRTDLRTEMADLRTDLRTEMADLRTDLRTEMADLRTDLRTDMADLRTDLDRRFQRLLLQLVGSMTALFTVALIVARLTG